MRKLNNFFKTLLSYSIFFLISNITFAQQDSLIKRQYTDSIHTATTVVVKNNQANDLTILNHQFDQAGFGDVIFIKTENQKPSKPKSERTSFEDIIKETSKPSSNVATATETTVTAEKPIVKPKTKPLVKKQNPIKTAAKEIKKTPTPAIKKPQKYFGVGSARKIKTKKKRLTKRRRVKRGKRSRCFQF